MSYESKELSEDLGSPIELYEFQYGPVTYRYTSADEDIEVAGVGTYLSLPCGRQKIENNQDSGKTPVTFTISRKAEITDFFVASPPTTIIEFTVRRFHYGDSERIIYWFGRVVNVKYYEDTVEFRCESIQTSMKRPALRRFYQLQCPHVLYGTECAVQENLFQINTFVESVSGLNITSAAFALKPDQYYRGGYIAISAAPTSEYRFITSHVGNTITINLPSHKLFPGTPLTVSPGCDHTLTTCKDKFNNLSNYGGFPFIPTKNPMGNVQIF